MAGKQLPSQGKTLAHHRLQDQSIEGLALPIVILIAKYRGISRILALPRGERQLNVTKCLDADLGKSTGIETQDVSDADPKPEFEPLEHSVYQGQRRLGRYSRAGKKRYAAYDAQDRFLGHFKSRRLAYSAVSAADQS